MGEREEFQDEIEINIEIMRAWKYLLKKEFRQFLRDPGLPRLVMTFPVLIVFVFPFAVTMELRNIRLAVIDNDRSSESSLLVEKCVNSGYFILEDICPTPQAARSMMDKGDIDAVLTINTGFSKYLGGGAQVSDPLPVGIAVNTVNGTRGSIGSKYLTACISSFIEKQKSSGVADSGTSVSSPSIEVSYMFNPYLDYKLFMLPALMVIVVTMMCGFLPALNIVGEKEKGTIEQINVTPVSKSAFVICKMIPYVVVAYIVVFACLLLTRIGFGYSCQGSPPADCAFYIGAYRGDGVLRPAHIEFQRKYAAGNVRNMVFQHGVHADERHFYPDRFNAEVGGNHHLCQSAPLFR